MAAGDARAVQKAESWGQPAVSCGKQRGWPLPAASAHWRSLRQGSLSSSRDARAQPFVLVARLGGHLLDGLEFLALHHVHVAQDALALRLHQGFNLAAHALRGAGSVGQQLRQLVEEAVGRLCHGRAPCASLDGPVDPRLVPVLWGSSLGRSSRAGLTARQPLLEPWPMHLLAIPYPNIDPVALQLGPLSVKWYGLAYIAGSAARLALYQAAAGPEGPVARRHAAARPARYGRPADLYDGRRAAGRAARLRSVLRALPLPDRTRSTFLAVWKGGMAFHGGLIGSIIAIVLFARRVNANPWSVLDRVRGGRAHRPVLRPARQLHQRASCGAGRPTVPWAMVFPDAGAGSSAHPSQLYEAFFEGLVLFAVLWWLTHSCRRCGGRAWWPGTFLMGYGLARSFCELFREPDPGHVLTLGPFTGRHRLFPAHDRGRHLDPARGRQAHPALLPMPIVPADDRPERAAANGLRRAASAAMGRMPVDRVHGGLPRRSATTAIGSKAATHRRRRRFRHRARDQPGVRRADRPVVRRRLGGHGPAGAAAPRRAGPGPRHADARCAARGRALPGFLDAAVSVHLVEVSPPLRELQRETLARRP